MMKLRTILIINTVIIVFASLAHVPVAIMSMMEVKGFEAVDSSSALVLAAFDIFLLASCIAGFLKEGFRLKIITIHAVVIALMAISIISMVANVIFFGPPEGNYSFGLGLTTALCAYSVYLARRVYVEYKGGTIGNYHWYTAGIVGVGEVAMFSRLFSTMFST